MLSLAAATELLTRAASIERLAAIATALRFERDAEDLSAELRAKLSIPAEVTRARVSRGTGALRVLMVEAGTHTSARALLGVLARVLSVHTPHSLWVVLGCVRDSASAFVGVWTTMQTRPHVRALTVDRHHVYASDAETLCALAAACDGPDVFVHTRFTEILGRDALTRRFYAGLREAVVELAEDLPGHVPRAARHELALLNASRLLFLAFLQTKGWLDGNHSFLTNSYEAGIAGGGRVHSRVLEPLFFGTLNTRYGKRGPRARQFGRIPYLNGGLFARTHSERRYRHARFSDKALGTLFGELLARYRFTPSEEVSEWSEAAVDPVILGRAFESLMDQKGRRASGAYYTPPGLVERATRLALQHVLATDSLSGDCVGEVLDGGHLPEDKAAHLLARVNSLRLLDPACGSGAFLVHALRVLADVRVRFGGETQADARRAVLAGSLFGVDVNPTAIWLCELRLWLALAVEYQATDPLAVPPLPNLDRNIRLGDALAGADFGSEPVPLHGASRLRTLRVRYSRAQGQRKRTLSHELDAAERNAALALVDSRLQLLAARRRDLIVAARSRDLFGGRSTSGRSTAELQRLRGETRAARSDRERIRAGAALAFSFHVQFADVAAVGGFDVIVGNPPWVRPHRLAASSRGALRARYQVCRPPGRTRHFGAQVDLAAPFVERSLMLLRPGGALALMLPAKLWCSLSGAGLRLFVLTIGKLIAIEDFTSAGPLFDAAVYPSLIALARPQRDQSVPHDQARIVVHRRDAQLAWRIRPAALPVTDGDLSAPWLLVPPAVRRAFDRLKEAGHPLSETRFGAPRLGVKTGCNDAFVVRVAAECGSLAEICSDERRGWVEQSLLRPALRGELVRAWRRPELSTEYIVWTHDAAERPLRRLPPQADRWLRQWRRELAARTDARAGTPWWQLFRTPAARADRHRVVWCDIGRSPRACVLPPGDSTVPINTCYVAFADEPDAWALAALLNGPLAAGWLNVLAEPARGGYRRYFAWTMAALPVPANVVAFRQILEPLGRAAAGGADISAAELLDAACAAYKVRKRDIAPLLEWHDV